MLALVLLVGCNEYAISKGLEVPPAPTVTTPIEIDPTTEEVPVETDTEPLDTAVGTTEPVAEAPVYANTSGELYEIDPETGDRVLIGSFTDGSTTVSGMVDVAIDLSGRMYGGTNTALYQIDPTDASVSKVCDTDLRPYALAFTSDGVLFAGAGEQVVEVLLPSCGTLPLINGGQYETSGDLVGLPDGYLYWTVRGTDSDELVRVDPLTGASFWVGEVGYGSLYGLGYDQGNLYGFSSDGVIARIDPLTGSTTLVLSDATSWWGATTNPVVW